MKNYSYIVQGKNESDAEFRLRKYTEPASYCAYCGTTDKIGRCFVVEHVYPVSCGGADDPDNLVIACQSCNISKGPMTPDEWRSVLACRQNIAPETIVFYLEKLQGHRITGKWGKFRPLYEPKTTEQLFENNPTGMIGL